MLLSSCASKSNTNQDPAFSIGNLQQQNASKAFLPSDAQHIPKDIALSYVNQIVQESIYAPGKRHSNLRKESAHFDPQGIISSRTIKDPAFSNNAQSFVDKQRNYTELAMFADLIDRSINSQSLFGGLHNSQNSNPSGNVKLSSKFTIILIEKERLKDSDLYIQSAFNKKVINSNKTIFEWHAYSTDLTHKQFKKFASALMSLGVELLDLPMVK